MAVVEEDWVVEVAEHAPVLAAAEVVERVPALVAEGEPVLLDRMSVEVVARRRGPMSIQAARADHPRRHGPASPSRRRPQRGPVHRRAPGREAERSAMPIRGHRFPINRVESVVAILEWVRGPA